MTIETTEVATVTGYWDDRPGVDPGWYCEACDADGNFVADSQKVWFPVAVADFGRGDRAELVDTLRATFTGAEVRI